MAQQATQQTQAATLPHVVSSAEGGGPESERWLAWEALRDRDLEEKMGQGGEHVETVTLLMNVMKALRDERGQTAYVGGDVFIEWDPSDPRARVSPDGFILEGQPPSLNPSIWQTWVEGCDPPRFAMEVVSPRSRAKDYDLGPMRYSALAVDELLIFDAGPHGKDAFALQLYRRTERGQFLRVYAGPGPVESVVLRAFWVVTNGGLRARLSRDAEGKDLVLTGDERAVVAEEEAKVARDEAKVARDEAKVARDEAEAERARAEAAETRVRELEALLRAR